MKQECGETPGCNGPGAEQGHGEGTNPVRLYPWNSAAKVVFDRTVAAGLLVVLAPVMLGCAAIVALTGPPGRVVEASPRVGKNGDVFDLHNFRVPASQGIGRLIKTFGLEHLPELFDVFRGDMSLVGPRPQPVTERGVDRPVLRPGMTGLWVLAPTTELTPESAGELERTYIASWSLLFDLRVLTRTVAMVRYRP
ncbi:MAG: sugar transferase [Rhodococcus sp. (in: high G+C Gram-positive bacteria)]